MRTSTQLRKAELRATMRAHAMCARTEMQEVHEGRQSLGVGLKRAVHYYGLAQDYRRMSQ